MNKRLLIIPVVLSLFASVVLADNITVQTQVSTSMVAVFNYTSVNFGTLSAGSSNNEQPGGKGNTSIDVTTNYPYKFSASATQFDDGSGHTFNQNNLKIDTNETAGSLSVGSAVAMTASSQDVDTNIANTVTTLYVGHWLSIPADQYAASYSSTATCTVTNM